jgi:hypothetical protein
MRIYLLTAIVLVSGSVAASSFTLVGSATCTKAGEERRVSMRIFGPRVPCDVIVRRSQDGFKKLQLLTDSKTDASVCLAKFHDFQKTLQTEGFHCRTGQSPGVIKADAVKKKPVEKPEPPKAPVKPPVVPVKNESLPAVPPPRPAKKAGPRVAPTPPPGGLD